MTDRAQSRQELERRAAALGVPRPEVLTLEELRHEVLRGREPIEEAAPRSWWSVARDLLAAVVEQGLHLPDAARALRSVPVPAPPRRTRSPTAVPTVTLAEIYAAQGHPERALAVAKQVLAEEPDHAAALRLVSRLEGAAPSTGKRPRSRPEPTVTTAAAPPPPRALAAALELSVSGRELRVRWALGAAAPALRWVEVTPDVRGALVTERELDLEAAQGERVLGSVTPEVEVRAALGVRREGGFVPVLVAGLGPSRAPAPPP